MGSVRLLRLYNVKDHTGLSKSEIYRLMAEGRFPKAIPLGKRSVAWRSDEIDAWVAERIHNAETAKATPAATASMIS
jgi:prophage regulatory protein